MKLICNYKDPMDIIETDPYRNNQEQAQIWLVVNWEEKEVDVINKYQDGTYSMRNHHGLDAYYLLPYNLDIIAFQENWEGSELQEILNKYAEHWEIVWDGNNYVGQWDFLDDYDDDLGYDTFYKKDFDIEDAIQNLSTIENMGIWDFGEWYCDGEDDYPDNYLEMESKDVIDEMIYRARVENHVIFTEDREQLIKRLEDEIEGMIIDQERMEHTWRI